MKSPTRHKHSCVTKPFQGSVGRTGVNEDLLDFITSKIQTAVKQTLRLACNEPYPLAVCIVINLKHFHRFQTKFRPKAMVMLHHPAPKLQGLSSF